VSLRHGKHPSLKFQLALVAPILLLCVAGARADIIDITIINATFEATCVGGTGTCTEVVNGSLLFDTVALTRSDSFQLTGTLNASLVPGSPPSCISPGCLAGNGFYDSGVLPSQDPIQFGPVLNYPPLSSLLTSTPVSLVPALCGGDQPLCNTPGAFPGGPDADYALVSGTYTAVDQGPSPVPEPSSVILLVTGVAMLGFLTAAKQLRSKI
jgi:hypothetical protein